MKRWVVVGVLGGWVLWQTTTDYPGPRVKGQHAVRYPAVVLEAYDTRAECLKAMEYWGMRPATEGFTMREQSPWHRAEEALNGTIIIGEAYECLPAGTDPRPHYKE